MLHEILGFWELELGLASEHFLGAVGVLLCALCLGDPVVCCIWDSRGDIAFDDFLEWDGTDD